RRAVLVADVRTLAVHLGRVVGLEEDVEELRVGDLVGVKGQMYRLRVPGAAVADLLVAGRVDLPAGVADLGREHARRIGEVDLHLPEAAFGERCLFYSHGPIMQQSSCRPAPPPGPAARALGARSPDPGALRLLGALLLRRPEL